MTTALCVAVPLFLACTWLVPAAPSEKVALTIAEDTEFDLEAYWEPCKESAYGRFEASEILCNVAPEKDWEFYGKEEFAALLPDHAVELGEVWRLDNKAVLPFLRQFHPGATARLHHEPVGVAGAHACLRAVSEGFAEILLRAHAEFVLEEGIYFCPAQFEGRLLLDRKTGEPQAFRLFLPSRNSNVDVNIPSARTRQQNTQAAQQEPTIVTRPDGSKVLVEVGQSHGEADIGWVPRMELVGGEVPALEWPRSIDDETARRLLRNQFYAPIDWLPLDQAVQRSRELGKPLHVISLFGTLDDESC
jgi:hypothetical protein